MKIHLACCCAALSLAVSAAEVPEPPLDEILVSAELPGPGLWKVSKDDQHVLWIFGTLGVEPTALRWKSRQLETIVAESQEIIHADQSNLSFDFGMFTLVRYLPAAMRARRNPHDRTLEELLPADVYARWRLLAAEYLDDDGIEKWRPFMAAKQLRKEAGRMLRPNYSGKQWEPIDRLIRKHGLRVTTPIFEVKIPDSRSSMNTFLANPLDDVECLDVTLKLVEYWGDDETINARATAWARGNLSALRVLPPLPDPDDVCLSAVLESQAVQDLHLQGLDDIAGRRNQEWLQAVDEALDTNRSTLALVPVDQLLKQQGKLELLRDKGYRVEDPE